METTTVDHNGEHLVKDPINAASMNALRRELAE